MHFKSTFTDFGGGGLLQAVLELPCGRGRAHSAAQPLALMFAILWPTQQQVTGSIIDADVTLFEVGRRRLEYLSQRKEKKESQKAKKKSSPSLLKERRVRGQMGKA